MGSRATVTPICLVDGCQTKAACRGICWKHYIQARRYVNAGKTSWEKLEELGVAKPAGPRGRRGGRAGRAWLRLPDDCQAGASDL